MTVQAIVEGLRITLSDGHYRLVAGTKHFVQFAFTLSDDWEGLTATAQFAQGIYAYDVALDGNNCAFLPDDIGAGPCTMMLYGTDGNGVMAMTTPVRLYIADSGYDENAVSAGDA